MQMSGLETTTSKDIDSTSGFIKDFGVPHLLWFISSHSLFNR